MQPFAQQTLLVALIAASALAYRATRKNTLTRAGAITGFVVGYCLVATGLRGLNLFAFYQLGSMATKYQQQQKASLDETVSPTSTARGTKQVLAVSVIAVMLSLYHAIVYGAEQPFSREYPGQTKLASAILAHHATSLADTWASELGMLSRQQPRSILSFRKVPPGTNGGVTLAGIIYSIAGGACIGLSTIILDVISGTRPLQVTGVVVFAASCGLLGSLVDSIFGAALQITYWNETTRKVSHEASTDTGKRISGVDLLTNEQVNLVSLLVTTYTGGWILGPLFFLPRQ